MRQVSTAAARPGASFEVSPTGTVPALVRAIGARELAAAIANSMIGAGIFILPGPVAKAAGAAAPLAYVIAGVVIVLVMICFAMAGSRVNASGGPYAYVTAAFGPAAGSVAGFLFCVSAVLAAGGLGRALAMSLASWFPSAWPPFMGVVLLGLVLVALVWVNIRGTRHSASCVVALTLAKVLPLLLFVGVGVVSVRPGSLAWPGWPATGELGPALLLVFWSLSGGEMPLQAGDEIKNPERVVPRAILVAVPSVAILYLAIHCVAQGVLGPELGQLGEDENAMLRAASRFLGGTGEKLLLLGATLSMIGFLSGDLLATPRSWFAFARGGLLPDGLSRVHPRFHTPHAAILFHAALVFVVATTGTFEALIKLSGAMILTMYLLCCVAAWQLHCGNTRIGSAPFCPPGASFIPWVASACIIWILGQQSRAELLATAAFSLLGYALYVASILRKPRTSQPV
jgi:amino acid transporter